LTLAWKSKEQKVDIFMTDLKQAALYATPIYETYKITRNAMRRNATRNYALWKTTNKNKYHPTQNCA